jgi:hypothetical protein
MESKSIKLNSIELPMFTGEVVMFPFDLNNYKGSFEKIIANMLKLVPHSGGKAFFTLHGKSLKKGETLRRGGAHIDGNYEDNVMTFGGGGWKLGEKAPHVNTENHRRQYLSENGGIIIASNFESCLGWNGEFKGSPKSGGDCSHIELNKPFMLEANKVYHGNNHFIHESLPLSDCHHRVMARITMPESHTYKEHMRVEV